MEIKYTKITNDIISHCISEKIGKEKYSSFNELLIDIMSNDIQEYIAFGVHEVNDTYVLNSIGYEDSIVFIFDKKEVSKVFIQLC
jgi:hypothetical protein